MEQALTSPVCPENGLIASYVADLRRLAEFCNIGTTLEKMLRDIIVCGVNCEGIRRKLLTERELTYERNLAIAQESEEADRNLREMRISKSKPKPSVVVKQEPVHQLSASSTTPKKRNSGGKSQATLTKAFYRCDETGHRANDCRFKEVTSTTAGRRATSPRPAAAGTGRWELIPYDE